ncbi:MAG TPA: ATP-binding protein [Rhodothermales bacterium]|nr:ATP-binding protein [Rhodothermales bacterium]
MHAGDARNGSGKRVAAAVGEGSATVSMIHQTSRRCDAMNESPFQAPTASQDADFLARLEEHRTIGDIPRQELEWLVAHGTLERYEMGKHIVRPGELVDGLYIILKGRMAHFRDTGGARRKVIEWCGGDVTGQLPYSRLGIVMGTTVVEEPTEVFKVPRDYLDVMPVECPHLPAVLVHVMIDRARTFKSSDLQVEKMASLGKLAAGLAHELNNPASAAASSARLVTEALAEADEASRTLGAARLDPGDMAVIEQVRAVCLASPPTGVLSPMEHADREEAFATWLEDHDVDDALATPLADTAVTLDLLDQLADALSADTLRTALRWVAAGCTVRSLAQDIERAASRVHELVSAVKGFTYMDHATMPEPVDVSKGLRDTLAVMAAKARAKSASLSMDAPEDLAHVHGFGAELNQVWANLIDNALDAVRDGGRVVVTARTEGSSVVVRVIDEGSGIPEDIRSQIFDPFFTTKPVGEGTGLGLDIVRRLVQQNDGLIDVTSEPGRTEFRVTLTAVN